MAIANKTINYLWLDGETTGLSSLKNDIVQLACIPVVGGVEHLDKAFNQYCQPINWNEIEQEALDINGLTIDFLKKQQSPENMVNNLVLYARQFNCRFIIAGYNVGFDKDFIAALFKKVGREADFLELFTGDIRDTMKRAKKLKAQLQTPNIKLATLAAHFGIAINAHDALSDISATIQVDKILSEMLGEVEIHTTESHAMLDVSFPEPAQLHVHSMYSHTDSLNSVKEWAIWAHDNDVPAVSFVDHGNAASLFDTTNIPGIFKKENEKRAKDKVSLLNKKIIGIPGCGLHVKYNDQTFYLSAWAVSDQGYKNLVKLASIGWTNRVNISDQEFPVLPLEQVFDRKEGLVFGVPGITGPIVQQLLSRQTEQAKDLIKHLHDNLDIRLELATLDSYKFFDSEIGFRSYNVDGGNIQRHINTFYLEAARQLGIKCVPVSDSHFLDPSDKIVQDCVSRNAYKDGRYFFESRHVVKSQEMFSILKGHLGDALSEQDFTEMIQNTHEIMGKAATIKVKHDFHLPKIEIPELIKAKTDDYNMQTYYFMMMKIKEHGRWNNDPAYVDRFKKEVDVIMKNATLNFLPYFLVYEDICSYARSSGLMQGIARGSAGGSLLSYYLKIIHVDPVQYNLPFERFLSHARIRAGSFPDIDLDIARRARPLVMKYLQQKYGLGFAQMATFSKMKTKKAIKDAMFSLYGRHGKDPEIMAVCDEIDDSPQGVDEHDFLYGYTDQEGEEHKGEVEKKPILANFFKQRPEVEEMVKKLIGAIAGWSRHASAFVISTLDLADGRVPTMMFSDKELGEIMVTQFDAPMVEKSGLVKADILGINTLNMVSDCMDLIQKNHGRDFREEQKGVPYIYRLPDADNGVFTDFYQKDTDSTFQFNTELIKGYASEFAPLNRGDLMAMTALCRPGALDAPLYDTMAAQYFMDVKNGKRTVEYLHSDLEPILSPYNGVFVYQEEVMKFLVDIVGYSWEESDIIRGAIAKKKHEVIMNTFNKIRESCKTRGWDESAIETICQQIQAFSRYSFNKSHSHAYAELGYITLYLKHHYPLEWWTAVLNNEDNNDKVRKYIAYLGDIVSAPSLKQPTEIFSIQGGKIVAPISAIKSVGPAVVNELVTKGPFASLEDYVTRVNHSRVNIGSFSALVKARAADDLMETWSDDEDLMDTVDGVPTYIEARYKLMEKYLSLRKSKTAFKDDMYNLDPIKVFLQEKEYNSSFNKSILADKRIGKILQSKWPALQATNSKAIPFKMISAEEGREDCFILGSVKAAENAMKKKISKNFGMILLYQGSNYKSGISKKGKPWHKVSIMLSDGYNTLEAVKWDAKKAFGWATDTIVYVRGEFKEGWKTSVSITIDEIDKVE
jgi:DNA polymerase-3 subunit alpha